MAGIKDGEKMDSPLFPRLHINDTDKGGPRAPPRNKMALYEQLSIPSNKLDSKSPSSSVLPIPRNNGGSAVSPLFSSNGRSFEKRYGNPYGVSVPEDYHQPSILAVKSISTVAERGQDLANLKKNDTMKESHSTVKGISFENFSHLKNLACKNSGDKNNKYRVTPGPSSGTTLHNDRIPPLEESSTSQIVIFDSQGQSQHKSDELKEDNSRYLSMTRYTSETLNRKEESQARPVSNQTVTSPSPSRSRRSTDTINGSIVVTCAESLKTSSADVKNRSKSSAEARAYLHQQGVPADNGVMHDTSVPDDEILEAVRETTAGMKSKSACHDINNGSQNKSACHDINNGSQNKSACHDINNGSQNKSACHDINNVSLQEKDIEKCDAGSEILLRLSKSALTITPDDVVKVTGEKQFWKARRVIVNQRRVFALQVFELHKLIKVQKLIAGSPNILLQGNLYLGKTSSEGSELKEQPSDHHNAESIKVAEEQCLSPKLHSSPQTKIKETNGKMTLPSAHSGVNKGISLQQSSCGSHSGTAGMTSSPTSIGGSPWCFPSVGSQWLVPVMSPSEGLVYKPYSGPCPPPGGFMAPVYGSCNPLTVSPGSREFLNPSFGMGAIPGCGVMGHACFQPYGMPVMNSLSSSSAIEQMNTLCGAIHKNAQVVVGEPNTSSSLLSSQMSRAMFPNSKESEKQGSSASSPLGRAGDALPLFPVEPSVQSSAKNGQADDPPSRVIKVVPHNPRSATESAERIFQSIQLERKQYD